MTQNKPCPHRIAKDEHLPMTSAMRVRVSTTTRTRFRQIAQQSGKTESELLRELVIMAIESVSAERHPGHRHICSNSDGISIQRLTLRIPAPVLEAARKHSRSKGMAISRWIVCLVQASLFKTPVMSREELLQLRECNYELAAIGRNLNQIARVLNAAPTETEKLNKNLIEALQQSVSGTQNAVKNLISASRKAWETSDVGID